MNRLLFTLFMIALSAYTALGMGSEDKKPSSPQAQEGKVVYVSIPPSVNLADESKIQQEDQNTTGLGQAR